MSLRYSCPILLFKSSVSLLIFFLFLSVGKTRVLKSHANIVLLSISLFISINIYFILGGALMLYVYVFIIFISSR